MIRPATAVGVRRYGRTSLGLLGPYALGDGTSLRTRARQILRLSSGLLCVHVGTEGMGEIVRARLEESIAALSSHGSVAEALGKAWLTDQELRFVTEPILLAGGEHLWRVGPDGEVAEPDDGIVAIGTMAGCALGVAKALLAHTQMSPEGMVEEALRIVADTSDRPTGPAVIEVVRATGSTEGTVDATQGENLR